MVMNGSWGGMQGWVPVQTATGAGGSGWEWVLVIFREGGSESAGERSSIRQLSRREELPG